MSDDAYPLLGLNGAVPLAPDWFHRAMAAPFEDHRVIVRGAEIEARAWGERGRPAIMLLHGNAAHLGWWSFLAPFLADTHRVVALSFSGMGGSGWREDYSITGYVEEMWAVADATGVFDDGLPVLIGHSVGGVPVLRAAATNERPFRAGIVVDTALPGPEMPSIPPRGAHRSYASIADGLDRFRLSPTQPCTNLYIADHLGRMGLKPLPDGQWTWRFDRNIWGGLDMGDPWADLAIAKVPLAVIRGELSDLTSGAMDERFRATAPAGTPFVTIPEAWHHVMVDQPLALVAALRALLAAWA